MYTTSRWGAPRSSVPAAVLAGLTFVAAAAHAQPAGFVPADPAPAPPGAVTAPATPAAPASTPPPPLPPPVAVPPPAASVASSDSPSSDRPPPPDWLYLESYDRKDDEPVPPGYMIVPKVRKWPLALGASVFGGTYLIAMAAGFIGMLTNPDNPEGWGPTFIPVVGPFITIATASLPQQSDGIAGLYGVLGGLQAASVATFAIGMLVSPKQVLVPQTPYGEVEVSARRRGPVLELAPPRFDVGWIPGPNGANPRASLLIEGTLDL